MGFSQGDFIRSEKVELKENGPWNNYSEIFEKITRKLSIMNHSNIDFFLRAFQKFSEQLYFRATASVEQKTVTTISFPYNLSSSHPQVFKTVVMKNSKKLPDQGIFRAAILTFLGVLKSPKKLVFFPGYCSASTVSLQNLWHSKG